MIVYFADRSLNPLGKASTNLPRGFVIVDDNKGEDVETGVNTFSCTVEFESDTHLKLKKLAEMGNYIFRKNGDECELYTIIDSIEDTKDQTIEIYAEDAGLDLINEVVGPYEATESQMAIWYIEKYIAGTGFEIGLNQISDDSTRKLSWQGDSTVIERLASIANSFGGFEVSYSFDIKCMRVEHKYINIYKKRGDQNSSVQLRLNKEIDRIVTSKSIANLATALKCTGGIPKGEEKPITLSGYDYDDGNYYVSGTQVISRNGLKRWKGIIGSNITKTYSYETTSQATLCSRAIAQLKKIDDIEVNYEITLPVLPNNVRIGDRVSVIDNEGELYFSTRILGVETSVTSGNVKVTLGEHRIKSSGISQKVQELAEKFAAQTRSVAQASLIADRALESAVGAQSTANEAALEATAAKSKADEAQTAAATATQSAQQARQEAANAQARVGSVEENVAGIEETVNNANAAAEQARQAAITAETKASEAKTSAANAEVKATEAKTAAENAGVKADDAALKASTATGTADIAKEQAAAAKTTADAAKLDSAQAKADIVAFGESLETLSSTMAADYARKTDLTETEASLQTQITRNATGISSNAASIVTIDETANNAAAQAAQAQSTASAAKAQADKASADALAAQTAADNAKKASELAQAEADIAKAAAETAQSVADKADADLTAAKADLETVTSRVGATEEEIAAAQEAVATAQSAADKAKQDAVTAQAKAADAQSTADTAVTNASNAQAKADEAVGKAQAAQTAAEKAQGDALAAKAKADDAATKAAEAQSTASTAVANAANAQSKADAAAQAAANAQTAAEDADAKAAQAKVDLATAQQNLAAVTGRVDATEAEVEAAQAAVETAQAAADKAKQDAATAQSTANTAKANAATAQADADTAKDAADAAQEAAKTAQEAADAAQEAVDALEIRTTEAETKITQNAEAIKLAATKKEVTETLGGYYTKSETNAALETKAGAITAEVSGKYATKSELGQEVTNLNATLALKIDEKNLISKINASADIINLNAGRLVINSGNFQLDENGKITSTSGKIGGFTIGGTYLANNTASLAGAAGSVYLGLDGISCGTTFKIDKNGALNATSGKIGAFTIDPKGLTSASANENGRITVGYEGYDYHYIGQMGSLGEDHQGRVLIGYADVEHQAFNHPGALPFYIENTVVSHPGGADVTHQYNLGLAGSGVYISRPIDDLTTMEAFYESNRFGCIEYKKTVMGYGQELGTLDCEANLDIVGSLNVRNLEISFSTPYIDFHYGDTSEDYTSRIIERVSGKLDIMNIGRLYLDSTEYLYNIVDTGNNFFAPSTNGTVRLGGANHRWANFYAVAANFSENVTINGILSVPDNRIRCQAIYDNTVTYAANTFIGNTGVLSRTTNTSSKEIKHDIKDLQDTDIAAERLYDVNVYQAKYNKEIITDTNDSRYLKDMPMFIIEDMNEKYPIAVDKPSDDVKEWSWNVQYLIPPMLKLIQAQHKTDIELAAKISNTDARIESLQYKLEQAFMKIAAQQKEIDNLKAS